MSERVKSPIRRQAADALRRARRLPIGHDRNDLRQLALGLLWLEKRGFVAVAEDGSAERECKLKETDVALISKKEPHGVTPGASLFVASSLYPNQNS
jgi:hypothetical protein